MDVPILAEDERLLVVDKPAGRVVVLGRGEGVGTPLVETLSAARGVKLFVVHRLDRDTSGVLVFAKTPDAHRELCAIFEGRELQKRYRALVSGRWGAPRTIDQPIGAFGSGRQGVREDGKPSVTEVRAIETLEKGASLIEAAPRTGRRHQIRVHLYSVGHPVLGDPLYGKPTPLSKKAPRLMLHASSLTFTLGGKLVELKAPLPPDFRGFLEELRG